MYLAIYLCQEKMITEIKEWHLFSLNPFDLQLVSNMPFQPYRVSDMNIKLLIFSKICVSTTFWKLTFVHDSENKPKWSICTHVMSSAQARDQINTLDKDKKEQHFILNGTKSFSKCHNSFIASLLRTIILPFDEPV